MPSALVGSEKEQQLVPVPVRNPAEAGGERVHGQVDAAVAIGVVALIGPVRPQVPERHPQVAHQDLGDPEEQGKGDERGDPPAPAADPVADPHHPGDGNQVHVELHPSWGSDHQIPLGDRGNMPAVLPAGVPQGLADGIRQRAHQADLEPGPVHRQGVQGQDHGQGHDSDHEGNSVGVDGVVRELRKEPGRHLVS